MRNIVQLKPPTHLSSAENIYPDLPKHDYIAFITNLPSKLNLYGPLEARVDFHLIKSKKKRKAVDRILMPINSQNTALFSNVSFSPGLRLRSG